MQGECPIENPGKCTIQFAPNVDKSVKSLSSQTPKDRYIAETAGLRDEIQEEVDIKLTS